MQTALSSIWTLITVSTLYNDNDDTTNNSPLCIYVLFIYVDICVLFTYVDIYVLFMYVVYLCNLCIWYICAIHVRGICVFWAIGLMSRVFTNSPGDWGSIQVELYQRLKKWYLMLPCLTLCIIRHVSRVKWSNPGKGIAFSPTPQCSNYWKRSIWFTLD